MAVQICKMCDQPATHAFVWEWGESGVVCPKHQQELQQTSVSLARSIQFSPVSANATAPLERTERVQLRAEALVLKEELEEAKQRGLDMYRQIGQLTAQVQSLTVREREAQAQRKDALAARDEMDERLKSLEAENATLADELGRLRVLVPPMQPPLSEDGGTSPGVGL